MAINRYRFYVGPLGMMQAMPRLPGGDYHPSAPIRIPGGVHESISGRQTLDRTGTPKRSWPLDFANITEAERLYLDSAIHGAMGTLPLRLLDPRSSNHLTADTSAGGSISRSTAAFASTSTVTDTFGATVSNGWGSTDTGQAWTTIGGVAGDYSKSAGLGRHSVGAVGSARSTRLATTIVADFDYTDMVGTNKLATGNAQVSTLYFRDNGANSRYNARIQFLTSGFLFLELFKTVAGVDTVLQQVLTTVAHVASRLYRRRVLVSGTSIKFKVWDPTLGAEPAAWNLSVVDSAVPNAGYFQTESVLFSGNTNVLPVEVQHDNLSITSTPPISFSTASVPSSLTGAVLGAIDWPAAFPGVLLTAGAEKMPVITGSTYRFSIYAKGSAQFKLAVRPFDIAGVEQTLVVGSTETPTGAWTRYEYLWTPSAGHVAGYFCLQAQSVGNLQTTGWWVGVDQAFASWAFGVGCPEVFVDTSVPASYWRLKYHQLQVTFQEV